jgi:hypothetical protein
MCCVSFSTLVSSFTTSAAIVNFPTDLSIFSSQHNYEHTLSAIMSLKDSHQTGSHSCVNFGRAFVCGCSRITIGEAVMLYCADLSIRKSTDQIMLCIYVYLVDTV